jgi:MoaA/NifB/PqqE/SkfB family radical SAM enzyme
MTVINTISNNNFIMGITLLNKCNYKCKYCPPRLNSGSSPIVSKDTYIKFFDNLLADNPKINDFDNRFIAMSGGEPSLYEGVEDLLDYLKSKNFLVNFDTNGSAKIEFWENCFSKVNSTHFSFHPRYANYKHFEQIIETAIKQDAIITIGVLMDPLYWDRAVEAYEFFRKYPINVTCKGLRSRLDGKQEDNIYSGDVHGEYIDVYTPEQMLFIKENHTQIKDVKRPKIRNKSNIVYDDGTEETIVISQNIVSRELNNFYGYKCWAGSLSLTIKWNGDVTGAQCGKSSGYFGNLNTNPDLRVKLLDKPIICSKKNKCSCITDIRIPKSRL